MFSRKARKSLFWMLLVVVAFAVAAGGFYMGYSYVISQNARFAQFAANGTNIGPDTEGAVMIVIPRGSDTKAIAAILADKKVVDNPFLFTLLSKANGFDGSYTSGTHFVTKSMTYDEIMYVLSQPSKTVTVTFPEGLTYRQMKDRLHAAGVNFDEAKLDSMVQNPSMFLDYTFVQEINITSDRQWSLQGYLFPDTYKFDMNADEETILRTFLDNTQAKLLPEFYARAQVLGMTMDQVITLASIVQAESGRIDEMSHIASVFSNRLHFKDPASRLLQSCAVLNYLLNESGLPTSVFASNADIALVSPYNTYQHPGLPPGPICNPGADAIRATLWPDKTNDLYFVAACDGTGASYFATTFAQHEVNVALAMKNFAKSQAAK